jgi:hypothetical protein
VLIKVSSWIQSETLQKKEEEEIPHLWPVPQGIRHAAGFERGYGNMMARTLTPI